MKTLHILASIAVVSACLGGCASSAPAPAAHPIVDFAVSATEAYAREPERPRRADITPAERRR
jgi:hypothetical protein